MEHISQIIDDINHQEISVIKTGVKFLDESIGGYYPGNLTVICGEENCCKTAFVIHQLCRIAVDQKIPTLLLLEYWSERNFISSMAAYYCNIETNDVRSVLDSEKYKETIDGFMGKLRESPLYIVKSGWYVDDSSKEKIKSIIESENIKIMFVDEVILDLSADENGFLKFIWSVNMHISIVVTCCVWNDREGFKGVQPLLRDVRRFRDLHGYDVVLGFTNFEQHGIFEDSISNDLHGMIGVSILKYRGKLEKSSFKMMKYCLYYRDYDQIKKQLLVELRQSSDRGINSLFQNFDLSIEDYPF